MIYAADGNRSQRTSAGTTTLYLVATVNPTGYPKVVEEFTASGGTTNLSNVYTYGPGLISQRQGNGTVSFFGTDGLGSTRFLTSTNGTITETYAFDAFGTLIASNTTPSTAYLFSGQQSDSVLGGLLYLNQRYNIPSLGRLLTRDGLPGDNHDPLSLHKYLYVENNPVNAVDPSGEVAVLSNWMYGQKVHDKIGEHFLAMGIGRFYDQPVSSILGVPYIPYFTASRPDLVQPPSTGSPGEVYEIKPVGSFIQGRVQLQYYLMLLNGLDPLRRTWNPGSVSTYTPPQVVTLSWGVFAFVSPPVNGVILYYIEDLRIDILCIAVYASTQIKMDLAEATLLNTLAPVY